MSNAEQSPTEPPPIYRVTTHVLGNPAGPRIEVYAPVDGQGARHYVAKGQIQTPQGPISFACDVPGKTLRDAFAALPHATKAAADKVMAQLRSQIAVPTLNGQPRIV